VEGIEKIFVPESINFPCLKRPSIWGRWKNIFAGSVRNREDKMYPSTSYSEMAERDLEEFEGDLERYKAANRRSVWYGAGIISLVLISACVVCSALVLIIR
jgi:hypothetical protein